MKRKMTYCGPYRSSKYLLILPLNAGRVNPPGTTKTASHMASQPPLDDLRSKDQAPWETLDLIIALLGTIDAEEKRMVRATEVLLQLPPVQNVTPMALVLGCPF
jgi:hypothetical protein